MATWAEITKDRLMCGQWVFWYDGEYEGQCERPPGHDPAFHYDGMSWFDDEGDEAEPDPSYDVASGPNAIWNKERGWDYR